MKFNPLYEGDAESDYYDSVTGHSDAHSLAGDESDTSFNASLRSLDAYVIPDTKPLI